jgi:hypothetical protein
VDFSGQVIIQNFEVSQETHSSGGGERGRTGSGLDDLLCRPFPLGTRVARKWGYTKENMGVLNFSVVDQEYLVPSSSAKSCLTEQLTRTNMLRMYCS